MQCWSRVHRAGCQAQPAGHCPRVVPSHYECISKASRVAQSCQCRCLSRLMRSGPRDALKSLQIQICNKGLRGFQARQISLTGAIERGIRHGKRAAEGKTAERQEADQRLRRDSRSPSKQWAQRTSSTTGENPHPQPDEGSSSPAPASIIYTKANSEFLYGTFAVKAALTARRRELHKLYVYVPGAIDTSVRTEIEAAAKAAGVEIRRVSGNNWLQVLGRMCQGRPHNGYVLEASPLPVLPALALQPCTTKGDRLTVLTRHRPSENATQGDLFDVQEDPEKWSQRQHEHRFPFCILLDRILDPGNLGAIIRSAYFFGVDRVILLDHGTAPLSSVAIKASAGAAEYMPMMRIQDEINFIHSSRANGWSFFGAKAPTSESSSKQALLDHQGHFMYTALSKRPVVLVLGSEGEGIRSRLARNLDGTVSVGHAGRHLGVDSLNVSVAASILIRDFLLPHSTAENPIAHSQSSE